MSYGYLSSEKAKANCSSIDKYYFLNKKNDLQIIFCETDGKQQNFKPTIQLCRDNSNQKMMMSCEGINKKTYALKSNLFKLIGIESYDSGIKRLKSFKELGKETAKALTFTSAKNAMFTLADLLRDIDKKHKKQPNAEGEADKSNGSKEEPSTDSPSSCTPSSKPPRVNMKFFNKSQDTSFNAKDGPDNSSGSNTPETNAEPSNTTDANS